MDTSELRRLADDRVAHPQAKNDALRQAADEIDVLRREVHEEHELYLIRTEERDEARTQLARAIDVLRQIQNAYGDPWAEDDVTTRARDALKELP